LTSWRTQRLWSSILLHFLIETANRLTEKPGFEDRFSALIWQRIFSLDPVSLPTIADQFGLSSARIQADQAGLARKIRGTFMRKALLLEAREGIDSVIKNYSLESLIEPLLSDDSLRDHVDTLSEAMVDWLHLHIAREIDRRESNVDAALFHQRTRFYDLVLALQMGIGQARVLEAEEDRPLFDQLVRRMFTAEGYTHPSLYEISRICRRSDRVVEEAETRVVKNIVAQSKESLTTLSRITTIQNYK
jgi:hypothetical protein